RVPAESDALSSRHRAGAAAPRLRRCQRVRRHGPRRATHPSGRRTSGAPHGGMGRSRSAGSPCRRRCVLRPREGSERHPDPAVGGTAMNAKHVRTAGFAVVALLLATRAWASCEDYREVMHAIGQRGNVNEYAHRVVVKGDVAYVATQSAIRKAGLYAVDVHDPAHLGILSEWTAGAERSLGAMALEGDELYAVSQGGPYIQVFDVRDPRHVVLARSLRLPFGGDHWSGIAVRSSRVYVTAGNRLEVLSTHATTDYATEIDCGEAVADLSIVGDVAYVGSPGGNVLMFDLSEPDLPRSLGSIPARGTRL